MQDPLQGSDEVGHEDRARAMRLIGRFHRRWILAAAGVIALVGLWLLRRPPSLPKLDLGSTNLGDTWYPIISIPWVTYGADFGGVAGWHTTGVSSDSHIDQWFDRLEQDGVAAVAWFLFGDGRGALTFEKSGSVRGIVPSFWADYHSVLAAAERHRLRVVWVLTDFKIGMPVQVEQDAQIYGHADLLEDPAKRNSFIKHALGPILKDKTGSNQIAGWILINEPEHLLRTGYVTEAAVRAFVTETTAEIKYYRPQQRVGLANTDLASMIQFADIESLDFLVFHHYAADLPPPAAFIQDYLRNRFKSAARPKPIFVGEFNLNFPPGLELDRFLLACREFGYAGVWPWSLRNQLDQTASTGTDTAPQFSLAGAYDTDIQRARQAITSEADRKRVRKWAVTEVRTSLLPEVQRRAAMLADMPASHQSEAEENRAWAIRCERELSKASKAMDAAQAEARRAQATIAENERWASHALPAEVSASRASLQKSREWRRQVDGQIRSIQDNIEELQHSLVTATERARMHSYLAHEASSELTWVKVLEQRLTDQTSLATAISSER